MEPSVVRCAWVGSDPLMVAYHDEEWGVPCHDDRRHLECLTLEVMQAGLSWQLVLRKRAGFRAALAHYDVDRMAAFGDADVDRLMGDPTVIRNRRKLQAVVHNARCLADLRDREGSFDGFLWSFVGGRPIDAGRVSAEDPPRLGSMAQEVATQLKLLGFRFVGPTVAYAHMRWAGLINDHAADCFRHDQVAAAPCAIAVAEAGAVEV